MLSATFSILESKIQHIEYQAQCNLQDCVFRDSKIPGSSIDTATNLTQNLEWMLQQIKLRSSELKRLQLIRCWLREENLAKVMELLEGDNYLIHTEEGLEKMLKRSGLELLRLQYST